MEDLRRQGKQGLLGTQMVAVVVERKEPNRKRPTKVYRLPNEQEIAAATVEIEDLTAAFEGLPFGLLTEPIPKGGGSGACRAFSSTVGDADVG